MQSTLKLTSISAALIGVALIAFPAAAFAQEDASVQKTMSSFIPKPHRGGNTLTMSCAHAKAEVRGLGGTILYTGSKFDTYHKGGEFCLRVHQVQQDAYVQTRNNPQCFVGYRCVEPQNNGNGAQ